MKSPADHSQEKQTRSVANDISVQQSENKTVSQQDNRPETIAQRKLQESLKNGAQGPLQRKEKAIGKITFETENNLSVAENGAGREVIQAWPDLPNWQADANLATAAKTVIYGADFDYWHARTKQAAHADDMAVYAARYDGLQGANGGKNTMVWKDDLTAAMGAINYTDAAVIVGSAADSSFSVYLAVPSKAFAWSPLVAANKININNLRLDVRNDYDNVEVSGYVKGRRNAANAPVEPNKLTNAEFKITHLHSAW